MLLIFAIASLLSYELQPGGLTPSAGLQGPKQPEQQPSKYG